MRTQIEVKQFFIITIAIMFSVMIPSGHSIMPTELLNNNKNIKNSTSYKNIKVISKTKKRTRIKKRRSSSRAKIRNKNDRYNVILKSKNQKKIASGVSCEFRRGIVAILDIIRTMLTARKAEVP